MSRIFNLYLAMIFGDIPNAVDGTIDTMTEKANDMLAKRNNRGGLSLVELMIVVAIIVILGATCTGVVGRGCIGKSQKVDATEQATAYANFMYPGKNPRIQCVRLDSDHDGYVSCTIAYDAENAVTGLIVTDTVAVECAAGFTLNEGCRIPKARVNTQ